MPVKFSLFFFIPADIFTFVADVGDVLSRRRPHFLFFFYFLSFYFLRLPTFEDARERVLPQLTMCRRRVSHPAAAAAGFYARYSRVLYVCVSRHLTT